MTTITAVLLKPRPVFNVFTLSLEVLMYEFENLSKLMDLATLEWTDGPDFPFAT